MKISGRTKVYFDYIEPSKPLDNTIPFHYHKGIFITLTLKIEIKSQFLTNQSLNVWSRTYNCDYTYSYNIGTEVAIKLQTYTIHKLQLNDHKLYGSTMKAIHHATTQ